MKLYECIGSNVGVKKRKRREKAFYSTLSLILRELNGSVQGLAGSVP